MLQRTLPFVPFIVTLFTLALPPAGSSTEHWVACGDDQLRFYSITDGTARETGRLEWGEVTVPQRHDVVKDLAGLVECKPVDDGRQVLVASWMGGVARLDLATTTVNFSANVPSAHAAEMLPGNRIAVAGSRLAIFDARDGRKPLITLPLEDGHGLYWDDESTILYVLSERVLQMFTLHDWETSAPRLTAVGSVPLPGQADGHDLTVTDGGSILVSTRDGAWQYHPETSRFTPHPFLNPAHRLQSIVGAGSVTVWVGAEESWWARGFSFRDASGRTTRVGTPDIRLYKVRYGVRVATEKDCLDSSRRSLIMSI